MITLREELFASLVIGSKTYIIVDQEYRLWMRSEWVLVGNLSKERGAERDRLCAAADASKAAKVAAEQKAIDDLKDTLRKQGIKEELITKFFSSMKPDEIRSMLGLT